MKKSKMPVVLGVIMSVVGLALTIFNSVTVYQIVNRIWVPLNNKGVERGAGMNVALLCVGAVILVAGIVCIVMNAKKNKK